MKKNLSKFVLGLFFTLNLLSARAEYHYFSQVQSGSDGVVQEIRWPYWNNAYYNTWLSDYWTSSEGTSGYFYNGLALPAAGSPNPVATQQTLNWSFWPLSNPVNISDTISSGYTSPNTFSMQTIGEGTIFRSPGLWSSWQTNVWYRMAFRTWQPVNGTPHLGYAGTWLRDPVTGNWYHMATVQTPFAVTGIDGLMGFQEDATGGLQPQRTDYRNCYYHKNGTWNVANKFYVYDHGGGNENVGLIENGSAVYYEICSAANLGYTGTITNGMTSPTYTMTAQPTTMTLDAIVVSNANASMAGTQLVVQWQIPATSSPQFAYKLDVYTNANYTGTITTTFYDINPETRQKLLNIGNVTTPYARLTIIDIFNQTNSPVYLTPTNVNLNVANNISGVTNGLNFAYYESASNIYGSGSGTNWSAMPNFALLSPIYQGAVSGLDLTPQRRHNGYAFNYSGYVNVPTDGLYMFTLNSDAGSKLYVDGQLVVNWDGEHSPSDLSGWIGLQAGYHTFNTQYFCDTQPTALFNEYFDTLTLSYEGPGIVKTVVPTSAYYRVPNVGEPAISLSSPTNGATISVASVPLGAMVNTNGATVNNVQFYVGNNYWAQAATLPYSVNSFFWANNNNPVHARLFYNNTNILDSAVNLVTTTNTALAPWQYGQIFYHNTPNGVAIQGGTYSVIGDGMNLLTRQVSGDCTLIAHLAGLPSTATAPDGSTANSSWQAGIILRGSTNMTPGYPWGQIGLAPFTAVFGQVDGGTYYQDESMVNGGGGYASGNLGGQKWFKIQRAGNTFTSSVSSDGITWSAVNTNTLSDFPTTIYAGFFTYAGPSSNPNIPWASFDNFSLAGNILGPPGVSVNPQTDTSYVGQSVALTANPSGNAPFLIQWQYNNVNLAGATNATLVLTNLQTANSGLYSVVLNNANGTATATATVTVLSPPPAAAQILSNNPVGYWRLNETVGPTAYDSAGNNNGTGEGGIIFGVPGVTNALFTGFETGNLGAQFDGADSDISIPPLNLKTNTVTITGWVKRIGNQAAWSGIFFNRANSTVVGLHFGTANELRYTWNNNGSTYNWNSGLVLPNNQWAFVALVIQPAQAVMYLAVNGTLNSATNLVTNPAQAFDGTSYIGQDPAGGRYFNGVLDEVAIYKQSLNHQQISQILSASQQTAPSVSLSAPASGAGFAAPGTINLTASVITNGHAITSVQFYNGTSLLGTASDGNYSYIWTNVPVGTYTLFAQMVYDGGNLVNSAPIFITVNSLPLVPAAPTVTALASNLISISWPPVTYATSYNLIRNGSVIAILSGNNYQDIGLAANSNYCYSVVASNSYGSSSASTENCATTPGTGTALLWDATTSTVGATDGGGNWGNTAQTWWNGSANVAWTDNTLAILGNGTTTNCTVTITNNITPSEIIFNVNNGGGYTIGGGNVINFSNTAKAAIIEADDANSAVNVVIQGAGNFIKTGSGSLTLSLANTLTGSTTVSNGTLILNAYHALNNSSITIQSNATVSAIVSGGNALQYYAKTLTVKSGGTLTLGNASFSNLGGYLYLEGGATFGGNDSGSWGSWQINNNDSTIHVANGSPMAAVITAQGLHGINGKPLIFNVADVTGDANIDLLISGTLTTGEGDNSNFGITKTGAGTMTLAGNNTYIGATTNNAGTLLIDGSITSSSRIVITSGATLGGTGTISGATVVQSGGILAPGDNAIGTLTVSNTLSLAGITLMELGKTNTALSRDLVKGITTLSYGGSLIVTNLGISPFVSGDSFILFKATAYNGSFTSYALPALAGGLAWDTSKLTINGSITVYTPARPLITSAVMGNGSFNLGGTGVIGKAYILMTASNLTPPVNWTSIATNTADNNGGFNFTDPQVTNSTQRFYQTQTQ